MIMLRNNAAHAGAMRSRPQWPDFRVNLNSRVPAQSSSLVGFGRILARISDEFLLKSIDCRIQIPVFLNGVTRLGP